MKVFFYFFPVVLKDIFTFLEDLADIQDIKGTKSFEWLTFCFHMNPQVFSSLSLKLSCHILKIVSCCGTTNIRKWTETVKPVLPVKSLVACAELGGRSPAGRLRTGFKAACLKASPTLN